MDASNNNFIELLGADIAKNEQLLKEQPIIAPEPLKEPAEATLLKSTTDC